MKTKLCNKCDVIKNLSDFSFRSDTKKYRNCCKICRKEYHKSWENKNRDYINEKHKIWTKNNSDKRKLTNKKYVKKNYNKIRKYQKVWLENNKEQHLKSRRKYENKKFNTDPCFRIGKILRNRLNIAIKCDFKNGSAVRHLGCSLPDLKQHLESKFYTNLETNEIMSWNNYGVYGWHIDHIVPLSKFNLSIEEELKAACHYTNLQPMWAKENLSKGAKI